MTRTTKLFILGGIGVLCYRVVFFSAFAYPCTDLGDTIWFTVVILPAIGLLVFGYGIWFYKQKKQCEIFFLLFIKPNAIPKNKQPDGWEYDYRKPDGVAKIGTRICKCTVENDPVTKYSYSSEYE